MSITVSGAATAAAESKTRPFDIAQAEPSRGVPTGSIWKAPRASEADYAHYKIANEQKLRLATELMGDKSAELYTKLKFLVSRESGGQFSVQADQADEIAQKLYAATAALDREARNSPQPSGWKDRDAQAQKDQYRAHLEGNALVKGYISQFSRD